MTETNDKINELLSQFEEHRNAIHEMIQHVERIKSKIDKIIPDKLDARYIRYFEEKVKSITGLFNTILDMRKEIAKSVKDEIELRRKIDSGDDLNKRLEELLDVRSLVAEVNKFKKEDNRQKEKRISEFSDIDIFPNVGMPFPETRQKEDLTE